MPGLLPIASCFRQREDIFTQCVGACSATPWRRIADVSSIDQIACSYAATMDVSSFRRFTTDEDPGAVPCSLVYLDGNAVWYDMSFVFLATKHSDDRKDFDRACKRYWSKMGLVCGRDYYLRSAAMPSTHISVCNGIAVYSLLASFAEFGRKDDSRSRALITLITACGRILDLAFVNEAFPDFTFNLGQSPVHLVRFKVIEGLRGAVEAEFTSQQRACLTSVLAWENVGHDFGELVQTVVGANRSRLVQTKRPLSKAVQGWLIELKGKLMVCLGTLMDRYLLKVYMVRHSDKDPPVYKSPKKLLQPRRAYTRVDPAVIWRCFNKARAGGCSLETVVRMQAADQQSGGTVSQVPIWIGKLHAMYHANRTCSFMNTMHLSLVADPSTHSKVETMVAVAYNWEDNVAAVCDVQRMPATTKLVKADMPDAILDLWAEHRLQRVASYQEMQAISNTIRSLGLECGLRTFTLPECLEHIRPVMPNEVRITIPSDSEPGIDVAMIHNKTSGDATIVLPLSVVPRNVGFPLLVLGLDQGSLGSAGAGYMENERMMIWCRWDKYHRCVRDIKLSITHACHGLFLKAQLYTGHIWSMNFKPFGTGLLSTKKKEALEYFLETTQEDSPVFMKYGPLIARDHGMRFETACDRSRLYQHLPNLATSFIHSKEMCKLGRWFSWNDCAKQQLGEFWVAKMLIEHFLASDGSQNTDETIVAFDNLDHVARKKTPQAELQALKSANGGLNLAYKLMTGECLQHARILYVCTKACWTWYAQNVKQVKSPKEGLEDLARLQYTGWAKDPHLSGTIRDCLLTLENLNYMELVDGETVMASRVLSLTLHIVSRRAWSLAVRCNGPPACYIGLLPIAATQGLSAEDAAQSMKRHWKRFLKLEQHRLSNRAAQELWDDIALARNSPLRAMFCFFERERFRPGCAAGCHMLRGLLDALPDNKIVEDIHNAIRQDKQKCRNDKRCCRRIQDVALHSGVLEARGIQHPCRVQEADFVSSFKATKLKADRARYWSHRHRLPSMLAGIMGKKTWNTISEPTLQRSIAAWEWLQVGSLLPGNNAGGLDKALLSRLVPPQQVLLNTDGTLRVSLDNGAWGFLAWPLSVKSTDEAGLRTMQLTMSSGPQFEHLVDPSSWQIVPVRAVVEHGCILLRQSGPPEEFLRFRMRTSSSLVMTDLQRIARHLGLPEGGGRAALVRDIANQLAGGQPDWITTVCQNDAAMPSGGHIAELLQDDLFEAAFEELGDDDKLEFRDIQKEQDRKKARAKRALSQVNAILKRRTVPPGEKRTKRRRLAKVAPPDPAGGGLAATQAPGAVLGEVAAPEVAPSAAAVPQPVVPEPAPAAVVPLLGGAGGRVPRGTPWGRGGKFVIAHTHRGRVLEAITVTCLAHTKGDRCNKSLTLGSDFTEQQAVSRIKEWCIRGLQFADIPGSRADHMSLNPRKFPECEVRSEQALDALVDA